MTSKLFPDVNFIFISYRKSVFFFSMYLFPRYSMQKLKYHQRNLLLLLNVSITIEMAQPIWPLKRTRSQKQQTNINKSSLNVKNCYWFFGVNVAAISMKVFNRVCVCVYIFVNLHSM